MEPKCALCEKFFTADNPCGGKLPIKVKSPGGVMTLPMPKYKGLICQECLDKVIACMKAANKATGISFAGKDAHLND